MKKIVCKLVSITFVAILSACSSSNGVNSVFGEHTIESANATTLVFSESDGDIGDDTLYDTRKDNFNFDGLYEVSDPISTKKYYFRYGCQNFSNNQTIFTYVNWISGDVPVSGKYKFNVITTAKSNINSTKELCIVGDSITWWANGETLRKKLNLLIPDLKFVGSRTDIYGFGHEGEGGDYTERTLRRMASIKSSKMYLVHVGTNDSGTVEYIVDNIKQIAKKLHEKTTEGSIVYIATLLPRNDSRDEFNIYINIELRKLALTTDYIKVIDLDTNFRAVTGWREMLPDNIHPSEQGYDIIAKIIANNL